MNTIEVRKKLGGIVTKIFTKDFEEKYQRIRPQAEFQAAEMMQAYAESTNSYITLLSKNLESQDAINHLNLIAELPVIFTFYMRYYLISTILMEDAPEREWSFPNAEKPFFKKVLINFWERDCLSKLLQEYHDSTTPFEVQAEVGPS